MSASRYIAHKSDDGREQSVLEHLQNVARAGGGFADAFGARDVASAVGLCHDIGKYSAKFQRRINGDDIAVDHSTAGGQLLQRENAAAFAALGMLTAYCVMGHHGGLPDGGSKSMDTCDDATLYGRFKRSLEDYCAYKTEITVPTLAPPSLQIRDGFDAAFFVRMLFSALVDADWLDTEAFMSGIFPRGGTADIPVLKSRLFEKIDAFLHPSVDAGELNLRRSALLHNCVDAAEREAGLFTLTAPTGSGKTIASLAFALAHAKKHGKGRIIYVVPYNTIIEQNAEVFEKLVGKENVLQHHSGVNYDVDGEKALKQKEAEETLRKQHSAENWDFPLIVTSSVRFFESLFASKPSDCRKLHNIANSVIVFDEAQMLPQKYLIPCVRAIRELVENYKCTAVLTTATQSALDKYLGALTPAEITTNPQELYAFLKRVTIRQIDEPLSDDGLTEMLKTHKQVLCIVNTRKAAQALFEKLRLQSDGVYHLSTLMYAAHRSRVLSEIRVRLKSGRPCRVVSTSLVEAGVDLDFPAVYRANAGLDSIIQAAGRCNREGKLSPENAAVYVFTSSEHTPPSSLSPNIAATAQAVRGRDDIASLDAIRAYFEQLFYNAGDAALDKKQIVAQFNGGLSALSFPFRTVDKEFKIIDNDTQTIYILAEVPKLEDRLRNGERSRKLFRELGKYSVSLYRHDMQPLNDIGAFERLDEEILLLRLYYDKDVGVVLSPKVEAIIC